LGMGFVARGRSPNGTTSIELTQLTRDQKPTFPQHTEAPKSAWTGNTAAIRGFTKGPKQIRHKCSIKLGFPDQKSAFHFMHLSKQKLQSVRMDWEHRGHEGFRQGSKPDAPQVLTRVPHVRGTNPACQ